MRPEAAKILQPRGRRARQQAAETGKMNNTTITPITDGNKPRQQDQCDCGVDAWTAVRRIRQRQRALSSHAHDGIVRRVLSTLVDAE